MENFDYDANDYELNDNDEQLRFIKEKSKRRSRKLKRNIRIFIISFISLNLLMSGFQASNFFKYLLMSSLALVLIVSIILFKVRKINKRQFSIDEDYEQFNDQLESDDDGGYCDFFDELERKNNCCNPIDLEQDFNKVNYQTEDLNLSNPDTISKKQYKKQLSWTLDDKPQTNNNNNNTCLIEKVKLKSSHSTQGKFKGGIDRCSPFKETQKRLDETLNKSNYNFATSYKNRNLESNKNLNNSDSHLKKQQSEPDKENKEAIEYKENNNDQTITDENSNNSDITVTPNHPIIESADDSLLCCLSILRERSKQEREKHAHNNLDNVFKKSTITIQGHNEDCNAINQSTDNNIKDEQGSSNETNDINESNKSNENNETKASDDFSTDEIKEIYNEDEVSINESNSSNTEPNIDKKNVISFSEFSNKKKILDNIYYNEVVLNDQKLFKQTSKQNSENEQKHQKKDLESVSFEFDLFSSSDTASNQEGDNETETYNVDKTDVELWNREDFKSLECKDSKKQ